MRGTTAVGPQNDAPVRLTPADQPVAPAVEADEHLELLPSRRLSAVILDGPSGHPRTVRAVELLATRAAWYDLFVAVETMLSAYEGTRQMEALALVSGVYGSASEWFRDFWTDRLRYVVRGASTQPSVVAAAQAFLAYTSTRT